MWLQTEVTLSFIGEPEEVSRKADEFSSERESAVTKCIPLGQRRLLVKFIVGGGLDNERARCEVIRLIEKAYDS